MSFSLREIASFGSRPALLFEFQRDNTVYRYTSADRTLVVGGDTYEAKPMRCGAVRYTGDAQADELTIAAPTSLSVISDFVLVPPQSRVRALVKRYHEGAAPVVRFAGIVNRVRQVSRAKSEIICTSFLAGLQQNGARLVWQRQCPHALYSRDCGVSKAANAVSAVVTGISGVNVVANGLTAVASGRLIGGFMEWTTANGFSARRAINFHSGDTISVLGGTSGLAVGMTIVAYPGCARTPDACNEFGNGPNFGGIRHLPGRSPFDGNPVF